MGCGNEIVRIVLKQSAISGTKPTIPATDDHSQGGWLPTDIYKGEPFVNVADGITWTRAVIDGTDTIVTIDGYTDIYKAVLNQIGGVGNNPIAYYVQQSLGAIVWTRSGTGVYLGTLSNAFPAFRTVVLFPDMGQATQSCKYEWIDASNISIKTFSGGSPADSIITKLGIFIGILPLQTPAS